MAKPAESFIGVAGSIFGRLTEREEDYEAPSVDRSVFASTRGLNRSLRFVHAQPELNST